MDYSQAICDIYRHFKDCHPTKERKVLIVFGDIIADVESNKKLKPIVNQIIYRRKTTQHLTCVYISILIKYSPLGKEVKAQTNIAKY